MPIDGEPTIGEPGEKLQVTLLDMAHRFERVRQQYEAFMRALADGEMTPLDRRREIRKIMSGVDILVGQCIRFAVNRGIGGELRSKIEGIKTRAKEIGLGRRNRRVRQFRYEFLQTTSECEGWCEKNKLLYYVGDVFEDVTEEVWRAALSAGRRKYVEEHPEVMLRPRRPSIETLPPTPPPPTPVAKPEPESSQTPDPEPMPGNGPKKPGDDGPLSKKFDEFMKREDETHGDPKH